MVLTKDDVLDVRNGCLQVNGKPFIVEHTIEPLHSIEDGRLVTLFRGHLYNYWDPEDIYGYYA